MEELTEKTNQNCKFTILVITSTYNIRYVIMQLSHWNVRRRFMTSKKRKINRINRQKMNAVSKIEKKMFKYVNCFTEYQLQRLVLNSQN